MSIITTSFPDNVKQWVSIDNQIHRLNEELKELRSVKKTLTQHINDYVEERKLNGVRLSESQGQLRFVKVKETQPLTFKHLETCLHEILPDKEKVAEIIDYVKNKREITYVSEIKRLYNN
jgi:hypothetical protein